MPNLTPLAAIGTDPVTGARIETNQDDYAPGEKVHVTGSGWAPGEIVHLNMTEEPNTHDDISTDVTADSTGAFSEHFYDVQPHDLGVTFTLTATGQTSGSRAAATFTDGQMQLGIVISPPGAISGTTIAYTLYKDNSNCAAVGSTELGTYTIGGTRIPLQSSRSIKFTVPAAAAGYTFSSWSGDVTVDQTGSGASAVLCVHGQSPVGADQNKDLTLTYISGGGSVTTTTEVLAAPSPSAFGQSVTFTATVTPASGPAATGTVRFYEFGAGQSCTTPGAAVALGTDNSAPFEYATTGLSVGAHTITACFDANAGWTDSEDDVAHTVNKAVSSLTVTSDNDPSDFGENVKFEATVAFTSGSANPDGGSINFAYGAGASCNATTGAITGGTSLGSVLISGGKASVTVSNLPVGEHDILACYGGNANIAGSAGTFENQDVAAIGTTTLLSAAPVSPSTFGQLVTFTATVTPASGPAATGTVKFYEFGASQSCTTPGAAVALETDGSAPFTYATTALSVGTHTITACFDANAGWTDSEDDLAHTVNKATTSLGATSDNDPSEFGENVKFEATITFTNGTANPNGGSIAFAYGAASCNTTTGVITGGTSLGSGTIASSKASVTVNTLPVGVHDITACYGGNASIAGSSGAYEDQNVDAVTTTPTLSVAPSPQQYSDKSVFKVTITPHTVLGSALSGDVYFYVGGSVSCGSSAPAGSVGNVAIEDSDDGVDSVTYTIDKAASTTAYGVTACFYSSNTNFANGKGTGSLTVNTEDATIYNAAVTPSPILIGGSGTLTFSIRETNGSVATEKNTQAQKDAGLVAAGDIAKIASANVTVSAKGILDPNKQIAFNACSVAANAGTGYNKILTVTCTFAAVNAADTYDVDIDVTGNYYVGEGAAIIQVTDPAAGFATGGGWYWYDAVNGDKVNFGFMAKATVNKSKTVYQGALLVVRHTSTGDVIKVKSNSFEGYSIKTGTCPSVSFSGKATYSVNGLSAGNFAFTGYGEDCGEPGSSDKFGLYHGLSPNNQVSTSATLADLVGSAKTITGGNIQVPQPSGTRP